MPFPTLAKLAAKSVAEGIKNEAILLEYTFDTKCSNAIVRELFYGDKLFGNGYKKLELYKDQLSVTKVNFAKYDVDAAAVRNLKNFNLVSLDFGLLWLLEEDFPDPEYDGDSLDIVSLLDQSMNECSRKSMVHLGFADDQGLIKGWEKDVSTMLPNLQSIDISCQRFNDRFQLSNFCAAFTNLRVLDISQNRGLSSLRGIRKLEHLQKLSLNSAELENINEFKELSELKNLKYLDVADNYSDNNWSETHTNPIRDMLAAGVRMETLKFLDCSSTSVTEYELEEFVKIHLSLETIAAICTPCNQFTISGIKMLNMSSLPETLEYLLLLPQRCLLVSDFMKDVFEAVETDIANLDDSDLRHVKNALLFVLRESFDQKTKLTTLEYYLGTGLFEHHLSTSWFTSDTPDMIELFYNIFSKREMVDWQDETVELVLGMLEATVDSVHPGMLIPDRVFDFVLEKLVDIVHQIPQYHYDGVEIISKSVKWMSSEQTRKMSGNWELDRKVRELLNYA